MMNEDVITTKKLRDFGFLVGGIFLGLFGLLVPFLKHHEVRPGFIGLGLVLIALGAAAPEVLRPVFKGWMVIGGVLGKINGTILLSIIYFTIFMPIALVKRMKGSDPLHLKLEPNLGTYRITSAPMTAQSMEEVF